MRWSGISGLLGMSTAASCMESAVVSGAHVAGGCGGERPPAGVVRPHATTAGTQAGWKGATNRTAATGCVTWLTVLDMALKVESLVPATDTRCSCCAGLVPRAPALIPWALRFSNACDTHTHGHAWHSLEAVCLGGKISFRCVAGDVSCVIDSDVLMTLSSRSP